MKTKLSELLEDWQTTTNIFTYYLNSEDMLIVTQSAVFKMSLSNLDIEFENSKIEELDLSDDDEFCSLFEDLPNVKSLNLIF